VPSPFAVDVDSAYSLLHRLGWSVSDWCYRDTAGQAVWMVTAFRGDEGISVQARGQTEAWNEALRQAGLMERGMDG